MRQKTKNLGLILLGFFSLVTTQAAQAQTTTQSIPAESSQMLLDTEEETIVTEVIRDQYEHIIETSATVIPGSPGSLDDIEVSSDPSQYIPTETEIGGANETTDVGIQTEHPSETETTMSETSQGQTPVVTTRPRENSQRVNRTGGQATSNQSTTDQIYRQRWIKVISAFQQQAKAYPQQIIWSSLISGLLQQKVSQTIQVLWPISRPIILHISQELGANL